jgi:predicted PurR-regulated permease PerM
MSNTVKMQPQEIVRQVVEISVPLLVIAIFLVWSFGILAPFIDPIVWAAVIAVASYPVFLKAAGWLGGRRKLAVVLLVLLALGAILAPVLIMGNSLLHSTQALGNKIADGTLEVPPPPEKVKDWPFVGKRLHATWQLASSNLGVFIERYQPQLQHGAGKVLSGVAGAGVGVLQLILAIVIAAIFLLKVDACTAGMTRLARRVAGHSKGDSVIALSTATVRSVAVGVLGVAFIQAALAAIGIVLVGIPAAGIWAFLVLLLAIVQLPPLLILLPLALWVFGSTDSQTTAWIFLVYSLVVSFSDGFLKPMLLGRGVDVPMLVILLGAIGGMIRSGILGLFVGAVVLALGYRLFMLWLETEEEGKAAADPAV